MHRYGQLVDGIFSIFTLVQIEIISVIRCCVVFFCFSSIKTGGGVGVTVIFCKPLFIVDSLIECVSWVILWRSCVRRCLAVVSLAVSYHHFAFRCRSRLFGLLSFVLPFGRIRTMNSSPFDFLLDFLRGSVGGEFFCRLYRATDCPACTSHQLQTPTFRDIINDPSFRVFLERLFVACQLSDVVGPLHPFSRNLERVDLFNHTPLPLPLAVRCDITCQLRLVIDRIASAFFVVRPYAGRTARIPLRGSEIKWETEVVPIFSLPGVRFADVFRHPYFCGFVSSIGMDAHGTEGSVECFVGPTFLHYIAFCRSNNEESHLAAIRAFDEADKSSLPSDTVPFSQIRDSACGSAAYFFRKKYDTSWNVDGETYGKKSPVFKYLLDSYRSGPMFRPDVVDDIGAPDGK